MCLNVSSFENFDELLSVLFTTIGITEEESKKIYLKRLTIKESY